MGVSRWAKSNKSCSRTNHFQANDCMFFRKNWTCRNRTTRITQNSQFWMVHNYLYTISCLPRNQENQLPKTNHSSPQQCELAHIGSNNCIFEHSKPEEAVDAFRMHVLGILQSEWQKCFDNWFKRMQQCIDLNGEYFEKQLSDFPWLIFIFVL